MKTARLIASISLDDYADSDVPHVILMLDSVPYRTVAQRYGAGKLRLFAPPTEIVPPFPSITEICFTDVLHAPMLPGMNDEYFDLRTQKPSRGVMERINGYKMPWERRLHYTQTFYENACSFLNTRNWYFGELPRAKKAVDESPDRVTIVYIGSASAMVCKFGEQGCDEVLDGAEQFCMQLLYERHGAIKFSMMADHGHNYVPSINVDIGELLEAGGFHVAKRVEKLDDVVIELNGLVTSAGIYTMQPKRVAAVLNGAAEIEFAMYLDGDRVVLLGHRGSAEITSQSGKVRYLATEGDPLEYRDVVKKMQSAGTIDADGFASDDDWLDATADQHYPDAPRRIWDAFHRIAINTPSVIVTLRPGYCAGLQSYAHFFDMKSTHGGLSRDESTTFLLSMHHDAPRHMRSRDVLPAIEPNSVRAIITSNPVSKP